MDRTEKAKNLAVAGAAVGVGGGSVLVARKGLHAIRTHQDNLREIIRDQAAPAVADITHHHITPAIDEIRKAAENMKNATSYTGDIGKIYRGAKGGFKDIFHPTDLIKRTKAGFREGLSHGGHPLDFPVRAGKTLRKIVKGFSALDAQLDRIELARGDFILKKIGKVDDPSTRKLVQKVVQKRFKSPFGQALRSMVAGSAKLDRKLARKIQRLNAEVDSVINLGNVPDRLTDILAKLNYDLKPTANLVKRVAPKKIINQSHKIGDEASDEYIKRMRLRSAMAGPQNENHLSALQRILNFKAVDLGYTYGSAGMCSPCDAPTVRHYPSLYITDRDADIGLPLEGMAKVRFKLRSKTARQDDKGATKHSADIEIQSIDPIVEEKTRKRKEGEPAKLLSAQDEVDGVIQLIMKLNPANKGKFTATKKKTGKTTAELKHSKNRVTAKRAVFAQMAKRHFKPLRKSHKMSAREELNIIKFGNDPRPRNTLGEFSPPDGEGPSPNAVGAVYKSSLGQNVAGGAAAGVSAAGGGMAVKALMGKLKKLKRAA